MSQARGSALKPGDRLGQYELLIPVGAGGMGRVWAARERNTTLKPRIVAIKTALAEDGATEGFWKVLFDEGRIASQVTHPNVCTIHTVDRERGVVYLVMDWSDGASLRELLDEVPNKRLEMHMAVRIVARVCSGLHAVHELIGEDGHPLGVVHRDVSPQNVLISSKGQVRITDFGVAKARGQVHAPTQTGEVKGKIAYMAPEQVTTKDIDRRADVFALGCVLYEATVGQRPFTGTDALATLYALLEQPVTPPSAKLPGYPPDLEAIVLKALARSADDRYQTTEDLGRTLEGWLIKEKFSVGDADIAKLLTTTLGDRMKFRAREIDDAIQGIEQPDAPTAVLPRAGEVTPEPAAAATLGGSASPTYSEAPPKSSKKGWVFALVGAAALAGGIFFVTRKPADSSARTAETATPAPTTAAAASTETPAAAETVEVKIRTVPEGATLFLDSAQVINPYSAMMPRDSRQHRVVAKSEGFIDGEKDVLFDGKEIVVELEELADGVKKPGARIRKGSGKPTAAAATPTPAAPAAPPTQPGDPGMPTVQKRIRTLDSENPFAK